MGRIAALRPAQRPREVGTLLRRELPMLVAACAVGFDRRTGIQQLGQLIALIVLLATLLAAFGTLR